MLTYSIITLGCKVNQYETQLIREQFNLASLGEHGALPNDIYEESSLPNKADVFVINTCVVTKESERKSKYFLRKLRKENPASIIVVTGCIVSGINKDNKLEEADFVIDNKDKDRLIEILTNNKVKTSLKTISKFESHIRAFIKIQDGCESYCSYCIIPYVRGKEKSRDYNEITREIDAIAENGYKEIVFTGIHLGRYGQDTEKSLIDLFEYLEGKKEIKRVRLSSFEPMEVTDELIEYIKGSSKICSHMHIPLQSGDNEILKRMNRNYDQKMYLEVIEKLKKAIPDISISTDIIVGFPGEEDKHFKNTVSVVNQVGFSRTHIFSYSDREKTAAFDFDNKVSEQIKKERYQALKVETDKAADEYKRKFVGKTVSVLIEQLSDDGKVGMGYTERYLYAKVADVCSVNEVVDVRVLGVEDGNLLSVK